MMLVLRESLVKDFFTKTIMYFLYAPVSNKNKIKNLKNIYSLNYHRDLFYKDKYHSIKYLNFNISQSQIGILNKKINIVFDEQLILIQKFFDKNLRIKRDKKYYEFKFGYWMLHIISNYFYFEKIIRLLKKKNILPIQNIYQHKIKLENTDHFFEILRTSEYQNYLFSNFLNENNISSIKIDENFKSLNRFSKKKSVTKFLYYYLINILFKFINPRSIIYDSYFKRHNLKNKLKIIFFSKFKVLFFNYEYSNTNFFKKRTLIENKFNPNNKLFNFLIGNMPSDFINSILYNDNNINKLFKPLNLLTFNNIFNSSFSAYCAVNSNKVKIFLGQHGSHYGIQKNHLSEQLERRLCHKYFVYGWSNHKNITNISLPPFANKITPYDDKKKILFVTNNTSVFFLRFQSHQQPFNNFKEHFQNPVEFIRYSKLKKNILFRNYSTSNDSSFKNLERIKKIYPNLAFDNNHNIYDSFKFSKIVVLDHLGTAFFESLSLNIPTFLVLDKNSNNFRDSFKIFEKKLLNKNLLFYSPISASSFINKVYKNTELFWSDEKLQKDIKDLLNRYYPIDEYWYKNWLFKLSFK